jgi:ATP-dependent exoDNAse (exonuclease V) alpha subunit
MAMIENIENSVNAELACESVFAIPEELSLEQNVKFIQEFIYESYKNKSMVADVNIHNEHANNPHVHIMSPLRLVTCDDKMKLFLVINFPNPLLANTY